MLVIVCQDDYTKRALKESLLANAMRYVNLPPYNLCTYCKKVVGPVMHIGSSVTIVQNYNHKSNQLCCLGRGAGAYNLMFRVLPRVQNLRYSAMCFLSLNMYKYQMIKQKVYSRVLSVPVRFDAVENLVAVGLESSRNGYLLRGDNVHNEPIGGVDNYTIDRHAHFGIAVTRLTRYLTFGRY